MTTNYLISDDKSKFWQISQDDINLTIRIGKLVKGEEELASISEIKRTCESNEKAEDYLLKAT